MAPQLNTEADIASFVNTVWADSMLVARENSVMTAIVTTFNDRVGLAPRSNAKYGTVTINQVAETDDFASQALTPSKDQTLTPYEYGAQFFVTDSRVETDIWAVQQDATQELGLGIAQKVDYLLTSCFSSLTAGTSTTGSGTNMTWACWFSALAKMRRALGPRPWVSVISPEQYYCMGTAVLPGVTVTNSPYIQDEFLRQFFVNNVAGVDIYLDANIPTSATLQYGAIFSPNAIALDWRRAPRIRAQRDESRRGLELNLSAVFAYGVWRPQYGVAISSAGTAPA